MMYGDDPWQSVRETRVGPDRHSVPAVGTAERSASGAAASTSAGSFVGVFPLLDSPWENAPAADDPAALLGGAAVLVLLAGAALIARRKGVGLPGAPTRYRRRLSGSARLGLAFGGLGVASLGGWFLRGGEPSSPLLYFGGIGLFGAVLVALLLPARSVPPVVAEGLHEALVSAAGTGTGESPEAAVYYPAEDPLETRVQGLDTTVPEAGAVGPVPSMGVPDGPFRSRPSGVPLYRAFRSEATTEIATDPETFAWQLCQGLTDWFELVSSATPTVEATDGVTVRVAGSSIPGVGKFDHPVVSFLGVALACERDRPVVVTVRSPDAGEYRISVQPFAAVRSEQPTPSTPTRNGNQDDTLAC